MLRLLHGRLLPRRARLRYHVLPRLRLDRHPFIRRHGRGARHFHHSRGCERRGGGVRDARVLREWLVLVSRGRFGRVLSVRACVRDCKLHGYSKWATGYGKGGAVGERDGSRGVCLGVGDACGDECGWDGVALEPAMIRMREREDLKMKYLGGVI